MAMAVIAVAYFAAAMLGLSMATGVAQVTLVWPPTGIALASVLLFGYRIWPAIALGAFVANVTVQEPIATALGIAAGNTAEALAGAWLLNRFGFDPALSRLKDVAGLVLLAGAGSTLISATVGTTSLCAGAVQPWSQFGSIWLMWWFGDAIGAIVLAAFLLAWSDFRRRRVPFRKVAESIGILALFLGLCWVIYGDGEPSRHPTAYIAFPFLMWGGLRFGQKGTTAVSLCVSAAAIWAMHRGIGPFASDPLPKGLMLLQLFLGVLSVTGLFVGAAMSTRQHAEDRLLTDYRVGQILANSDSVAGAALEILRAVGETLEWDVGAIWRVDAKGGVLHCVEVWHAPGCEAPEFVALTRNATFSPGVGLPGRVWKSARPAWIADVVRDENFPRATTAARERLHGAFGFPLRIGDEVVGVMEFFSGRIRQPDSALLDMMAAVGAQIGQFIERKNAEADRRNAQEALRESEERFRFQAETMPSIVWIAAPDGRIRYANRRWFEYCGLTPEESADHGSESILHPDDRERWIASWTEALREGRPYEIEVRNRRHDGVYRWFITRAVPWKHADGRVLSWFGVTTDIHDQKSMQEELKEADRKKDEFLATLAHELRNPLAPLSNALQLLRIADQDAKLRADALALSQRQLDALVHLVDDLLDVSRITQGKINLRRESVTVAEVVGRAIETTRPFMDLCRQQLIVEQPAEPTWLDADPTRIAQVVSNLLHNAAKFSERGGRIHLSAQVSRGKGTAPEVVLRVKDAGIGISAEMLAQIFDAFMQADRSLERAHGGLGIGLTLVKTLVEMHGGSVQAYSEGLGKGSEFVVRLPLAVEGKAPRPPAVAGPHVPSAVPPAAPPSTRPSSRRVLVVDDNQDAAETLTLLLRDMGHEVRTEYDGLAAVEATAAFRPEVVLLDIGLPKLNGYEAARRIRAQHKDGPLALIALTGWGQDEDRRRSKDAGFEQHLVKPVDASVLVRFFSSLDRARTGIGTDGESPRRGS